MSQRNEFLEIVLGVLLVFGLNILAMLFVITIPVIGLIQLLYVIPLAIHQKRQGRVGMMKGMIIGAVITALLNGGCWILITR